LELPRGSEMRVKSEWKFWTEGRILRNPSGTKIPREWGVKK